MSSIDYGAALSAGVTRLKADPLFCIVGFLIVGLGSGLTLGILGGPLFIGYLRGLDAIGRGEKVALGSITAGFSDFKTALILWLVGSIVVGIAFVLLIVPGLVVAPMWLLALIHLARTPGAELGACVEQGKTRVLANLVPSILALVIFGLVGGIGSVLVGVGMLLTQPIALVAWLVAADQLPATAAASPADQLKEAAGNTAEQAPTAS